MPLFILDKHWQIGHNRYHHKHPGVFGMDPEATPRTQRVSDDFFAEKGDRISGLISAHIKNFHSLYFIGIVEANKVSELDDNAWKD